MNRAMKKQQIHRHREQTHGSQWERGRVEKGSIGTLGLADATIGETRRSCYLSQGTIFNTM